MRSWLEYQRYLSACITKSRLPVLTSASHCWNSDRMKFRIDVQTRELLRAPSTPAYISKRLKARQVIQVTSFVLCRKVQHSVNADSKRSQEHETVQFHMSFFHDDWMLVSDMAVESRVDVFVCSLNVTHLYLWTHACECPVFRGSHRQYILQQETNLWVD